MTEDSATGTAVAVREKKPLDLAAILLNELCERVDNGEEMSDALFSSFNDARLTLADAVDRRIAFKNWIEGAIKGTKATRDLYVAHIRKLEAMYDRFREHTLSTVLANPDIPFHGRLGKISAQDSAPQVELPPELLGELTPETIKAFKLPKKYIVKERIVRTSVRMDVDAVKRDLVAVHRENVAAKAAAKEGEKYKVKKLFDWGVVTVNKHVRFRI